MNVTAKQRIYLDADKATALPEGHKDAAFLYASEGDEIPAEAAEKYGLVDGALPKKGAAKEGVKQASAPANKEKTAGADKGAGAAGATDQGEGR